MEENHAQTQFDIAIVGGGPAGLSAAVNARARGKSVVVYGNEEGPLLKTSSVTNYLGFPDATGPALLETFREHARLSGAVLRTGRVLNAATDGESWYLGVGSDVMEAKALLLAAGAVRTQKFPGEEEFLGAGVSYCATCDGMLYRGKAVAVLGFDAGAAEEAEFLREIGCLVQYFDRPRRCAIEAEGAAKKLTVGEEHYTVDGIFILRPGVAPTELLPGIAVENGFVVVNRNMETNLTGVFAAGDCTGKPLQLAKAVGEGLIAGQAASAYVDRLIRK